MAALAVTDLRGRTEVDRTDSEIASADERLADARAQLAGAQERADVVGAQARATATSEFQTQSTIVGTNASITSTDEGIFFDGFAIGQLNTCLVGVTQALDQVAVGQTRGALASLGALSTNCSSTG